VKCKVIEVRHRIHPSIERDLRGSSSELVYHLTGVLILHPEYTKTDPNPYTTLEILLCVSPMELDECTALNVENLEAFIAASMKGRTYTLIRASRNTRHLRAVVEPLLLDSLPRP
jgi:hypothetical protein